MSKFQEKYKAAAEENPGQAIKASSFTLKEKVAFYKKKWLKEHIIPMCCCGIGIITFFVAGVILKQPLLIVAAILFFVVGHVWRNNAMMTYIERNSFDGTGSND